MMNTGGEGGSEFSSTEIEAENDAHFSSSAEANPSNDKHEYKEVKSINTDSKMAKSLLERLGEERSQVSITSLPQEITEMIFSHLNPYFLSTTVTRVCRYFHDLLKSEGFWKGRKTLYVNEKELGLLFIVVVIQKCPNIRHLNVNFCRQGPYYYLTLPKMSFPYLRSLVMIDVDRKAENAVKRIVQGAPHLKVIKLKGKTTKKMWKVTAQAKELTTYNVFCVNHQRRKYEPMITNVFKSCCKLESVDIRLQQIVDWDPLLTLLEVCSGTLKRLSWGGEISDLVVEKLSTCPQISHLAIDGIGITNGSSKFIRNMKQIETLRFSESYDLFDDYPRLTNVGYIDLFKDNAFPLLKHLSFVSCDEVDDTVLEVIATNSRNLESLALDCTNVTDLGIRFMLTCCSNLRALWLDGVKLNYSFVKDLPICCLRLHFLALFSIPVPKSIIQEFLNTHPSYNFKICEELTGLDSYDLRSINLSDFSLKPFIVYYLDFYDLHIVGHK